MECPSAIIETSVFWVPRGGLGLKDRAATRAKGEAPRTTMGSIVPWVGCKEPPIGCRGSAPLVVNVWDRFPSAARPNGRCDLWNGVALNARDREICRALLFYAQQFFEITFLERNLPINLIFANGLFR
jgi:hypothetical protein